MKLLAAVSALAICGAVGMTAVAGAHDPAKTKVTIHYNGDGFFGKLKSSKAKCKKERKVKVFKAKRGDDRKLYSDITDEEGHWNTGNSGPVSGKFYARTGKIPGCKRGVSKTIET